MVTERGEVRVLVPPLWVIEVSTRVGFAGRRTQNNITLIHLWYIYNCKANVKYDSTV